MLAALVLLCASCASLVASYTASMYDVSVETWSDKASRAFSRQSYCPVSRVSVVPRYDLEPVSRGAAPSLPPPPPASIASDPERVAIWRHVHGQASMTAEQKALQEALAKLPKRPNVYEVSGCDQRGLFYCRHYGGGSAHLGCDALAAEDVGTREQPIPRAP